MTEITGKTDQPTIPLRLTDRVDEACDRFETAWLAGAHPRIEDYLPEAAGPERESYLGELLILELAYRRRDGENPASGDYARRFPEHRQMIAALFGVAGEGDDPTDHAQAAPTGPKTSAAAPARLTLEVTQGSHTGRVFSFQEHDSFLVGRSAQAHFQLAKKDSHFSRIHFLVEFNPPHCRLMDLRSTNGTLVNGERVTRADLKDGDLIQGGTTIIRVGIDPGGGRASALPETVTHPGAQTRLAEATTLAPPPGGPAAGEAIASPQPIPGYQILRELGRGGMGIVSLARRTRDGALIALKTAIPDAAASHDDIDKFLREARILSTLNHPHIVRFVEAGEVGGTVYFAMDYVAGRDADRLVKDVGGPLSVDRAVRLTCQMLDALAYAHASKFVHRDIKPSNLLVSDQGGQEVAKLADFGLARVYQASRLSGLTLTGDVQGTPAFMPPEQITRYRDVLPTSDLYAAGATLYYLLTHKYIYDFPKRTELRILKILEEDPIPIRSRRADLPGDLAEIIDRCLARYPVDRFADAQALRTALLPFQGSDG